MRTTSAFFWENYVELVWGHFRASKMIAAPVHYLTYSSQDVGASLVPISDPSCWIPIFLPSLMMSLVSSVVLSVQDCFESLTGGRSSGSYPYKGRVG